MSLALELESFVERSVKFQEIVFQTLLQNIEICEYSKNGDTDVQRDILCAMSTILPTSSITGLPISRCK